MKKDETPEERKERLLKQLEKGRETRKRNSELRKAAEAAGDEATVAALTPKKRRPKNLDRIVREILDDDEIIDKVVANQPEYWDRLPIKNGGYIITTVMMVKAMSGDIKAAEWIRKTGFGDKVQLESQGGFFEKTDFTIQVLPSKAIESGIKSSDVLDDEIKQVEE